MIEIRKAIEADKDIIWEIISEVISKADTYTFDPLSSKEKMLAYWCGEDKHTYVSTLHGELVGTFIIKDNQPGLGSHIANASFMVWRGASGRGVGKAMGIFALDEAKRLGYKAMQFNIVVKTNHVAIRLWENLGFTIIGEIPEAFNHGQQGLSNAYIMYKKL